jgi:hypothetical protein
VRERDSWTRVEKWYLLEKYGGQSEALSLREFFILRIAEDSENLAKSGSDMVPPYVREQRGLWSMGTHFLNPTASINFGAPL